MRFDRLVAVLLLACLGLSAAVPEGKADELGFSKERLTRIHQTIQQHIDSKQIAGAVTLVARKGKIANFEAHGAFDLESNKPMAKNSVFRIWSMSKPVAGVAILMLLEEGKLRLNDPVSKFIPEFKNMKVKSSIALTREINVQDLLTHVSGLGSDPATSVQGAISLRQGEEGLNTYIPKFGATPLAFQPGSQWAYSPLMAFDTLGRIVEVASGLDFNQFLKTRLFEPLGMKDTFFHPGDQGWPRVVTAYHRKDNQLEKTANPNWIASKTYFSGAGGLMSTAEDYLQFAEMLLEGGKLNGKRILSPKTVDLMASVFVPDTLPGRAPGRGFGLSVQVVSDPVAAGMRVSKGSYGWDGAYGTHFWIDPVEKIVGILMIQTDNPNRQLDRDFENAVMQAIVD
ncbi:serine hydrolase domain-containing protein [Bryobacter aggregatus]|uniref:serine hydrolase domain-containing protein n=1 Tax=Bryobacter aggregatus TaxID=360054 RepID=UPI00068D634A|nr:serine hydrolase domain-containing protein [Bryobacter aggregatus]